MFFVGMQAPQLPEPSKAVKTAGIGCMIVVLTPIILIIAALGYFILTRT